MSGIQSHHFRQIEARKVKARTDSIFLGFKITVDSDYSNKIKRHLLLGRKNMKNLDIILKRSDFTLLTMVYIVKSFGLHSNHCFLIGNTFISLAPFFYFFSLQSLHHVWVWISLSLSFGRFVVLLTSVSLCLLLNLGKFQTFFSLKQVFCVLLSLLLLGF